MLSHQALSSLVTVKVCYTNYLLRIELITHSLDALTKKFPARCTLLHSLETFTCLFGAYLIEHFRWLHISHNAEFTILHFQVKSWCSSDR